MGGIWNGETLPSDTLRNVAVPVADGRLVLSVRGSSDKGYLLERRRWHIDGHLGIQRISLDNPSALTAFAEWETAFLFPDQHYGPLREAVPRALHRPKAGKSLVHAIDLADAELVRMLSNAAAQAELADCVFHAFLLDGTERNVVLHDTLIAGIGPDSALWSQHYSNKALYRIDPVFLQARHHNYQPVAASDLSRGSVSPLADVRSYPAFQSSVFFPARHEAALGILHVGRALPAPAGESVFLDTRSRSDWTALAHDVLRYYLANRRAEAVSQLALTQLEHQVLALLVAGVKADEIQTRLAISHSTLRDARQSINQKMGTHDIRVSVNEARSYGLVVPSYFSR
ncbi:LuxR C-terminal-related transcriptional regulator [Burkholderia pseudomallei]|uniref:helix-turn-helix transcriptional regulator n=1 Tax=Burkholderia pseudomallei TaxID=28450 RepID=UPI001048036C|nr:LuxR C-terminal-related transcriptional regulator [Burkholderia pseudomallei]MCV9914964.1 LuxR C-terminal-related transcriptional regulator [Burkholderia pseudomallei]MCW0071002.1 LuxR C-terminal-related transcriptional regulator [Burkholderia pseudomallei]TCW75568.1 LuxR family transcriptional regulator [Burkholderia sp. SRS-46]